MTRLSPLSEEQLQHFLDFGFTKVEQCFDTSPGSTAHRWASEHWARNGISPDDPDNWPDKVHMVSSESADIEEFSPKLFNAVCQLLGGEETFRPEMSIRNSFIANYHFGDDRPWEAPSPSTPGWHKDGDFFLHFLDSPEQALLTIILWSDVDDKGGPTYLIPDSIKPVAEFLNENRAGIHPYGAEPWGGFPYTDIVNSCSDFRQATGKAGDVFLMHPYMIHASSQNMIKKPRLITNPPFHFKKPMCFNRTDGNYNYVEKAVLHQLGVDHLDYQKEAPRELVIPNREVSEKDINFMRSLIVND